MDILLPNGSFLAASSQILLQALANLFCVIVLILITND